MEHNTSYTMIRTYKYLLKPTKEQIAVMSGWLLQCCRVYNAALEERISAYQKQHITRSVYDQQKALTECRANDVELNAVPRQVICSPLWRLDRAYKAFFDRMKKGSAPGFPKFRSSRLYDSFSFSLPKIFNNYLAIPRLGQVNIHMHRSLPESAILKQAHIKRELTGKWFVFLVCDVGETPQKVAINDVVGIDVGLKSYATLSTGEMVENPRYYRRGEELIAKRSQSLSRKVKGSNGYQKAKVLLAKAHDHVRNQRLDHQRKLAKRIVSEHDCVVIEKLNVKEMVVSTPDKQWAGKSITDAGWGQFATCLESSAEVQGKTVVAVNPKNTTQMCSACGDVPEVKKTLADRDHKCMKCGFCLDRDWNAALNIKALGLSAINADTNQRGSKLTEAQ